MATQRKIEVRQEDKQGIKENCMLSGVTPPGPLPFPATGMRAQQLAYCTPTQIVSNHVLVLHF